MRRLARGLVPAAILALVAAIAILHSHVASEPYTLGGQRLGWTISYAFLLVIATYGLGLPDVPSRLRQILAASVGAVLVAAIGISLAQLTLGVPLLPRFVVFASSLASIPVLWAGSRLAHWGWKLDETRDRVVVVARAEDASQLAAELELAAERPAQLDHVMQPADAVAGPGRPAPLVTAAHNADATVVVLDRAAQMDQSIVDQTALLHESGVRIRTLSLFYDQWLGKLPIGELERVSLMFDIGDIHRQRYARRKRLIDLALALLLLPILIAVTPLVVVGNLIANRGPLLFHQCRVGRGGLEFSIYKFRTMCGDGRGAGSWTATDDPRVTPFGRILRRSHIDELPQLWNIVRGDLSIVGPRPEQPHYVAELSTKLPFYDMRHLVQPGLTGWAQVNFGYAASDGDALEKLQYEFWYLRHQRLAVDLRIIVRTLRAVLLREARR